MTSKPALTEKDVDAIAALFHAGQLADVVAAVAMQSMKRCRTYRGRRRKIKAAVMALLDEILDGSTPLPPGRETLDEIRADKVFIGTLKEQYDLPVAATE